MKFQASVLGLLSVSASLDTALAFSSSSPSGNNAQTAVYSTVAEVAPTDSATDSLTNDIISKLQFREAQRELERLQLDATGTLSAMRSRLREATSQRSQTEVNGVNGTNGEVRVINEEKLNEVGLHR